MVLIAAFMLTACGNDATAQLPTAPENTWMGLAVRPEGPPLRHLPRWRRSHGY